MHVHSYYASTIYWYFYLHIHWEVIIKPSKNTVQTKIQSLTLRLPVKSSSKHMHGTNFAAKLGGITVKLQFSLKNKHTNALFCSSDSLLCPYGTSWAYDTASWGNPSWTAVVPSLPHHLSSGLEHTSCLGCSWDLNRQWLFCSCLAWWQRLEIKGSEHRLI